MGRFDPEGEEMAKMIEIRMYRNQKGVFEDRFEAGEVLSQMLSPKYKLTNDTIVLAIPSGGVPVGIKIAEKMRSSFDLVIVRKMQIPGNTEAGFGAMAYDGSVFLNQSLVQQIHLKPSEIEEQANIVKEELEKRNKMFRHGKSFPELSGKTVILVDDGLASGYTMMASIYMVKKMGARRTVVAVPTAPLRSLKEIETGVDEIYCANIRQGPVFAVADAYRHWHDLTRAEVMGLLKE
jgi:predicted phosphoribosyltransferase